MPKQRPNQTGKTLKEYRERFAGYDIPLSWLIHAYNDSWPFDQAESQFLAWAGRKNVLPKRVRALGLKTLRRMVQRDLDDIAIEYAKRRLMPSARMWLERYMPIAKTVKPPRYPDRCDVVTQDIVGRATVETEGLIVQPGYEEKWEQHVAEEAKKKEGRA